MGLHDGHRKRLKAQFLAHGEELHDHQLLELLLFYAIPQGDVNELAHRLLAQFGSLSGVMDALPEVLRQVPGVGEHTAVLLKLVPKLAGRYQRLRAEPGAILTNAWQAEAYLSPYFRQGPRNEMSYLLCMDGKQKVVGCFKLGEGTVNATELVPRKVAERALSVNSAAVILAHNHISGLAIPSECDVLTTETLYRVLRGVGVELADHLIFTDDDMVSMRDSGYFTGYDKE